MPKPHVRLKMDGGMPRASAGAYAGASATNRDVIAWNPSRGSAMADLIPDLPNLIYRNRDIYRNNGVAHAGVQTIIDNVVGTGIRLSARPNYLALGQTKEWAVQWAQNAQSLYHAWWHSTACDAADTLTGDQLTAQVMFSKLNNGASFTLPLWIPDRGDGYATKLQTVEVDRLSNPYGNPDIRTFHGGIEFGEYGEPIAAHIRKGHPGDTFNETDMRAFTWERIPRRTSFGRLRWIHDFDSDRPGLTRGAPLMAAILPQFKNLDRYTQAELQAAVGNAMIFATLETTMTGDEILELFTKDPAGYYKARSEQAVRMQSGSMLPLAPGDKMNSFLPTRPAAGFGAFIENIYRIIGVALDMPYELLMKDFSKTTYSSARAAMLEAWRSFNRRRDWLGTMWLDPIYGLFLEELVNDGRIDAPGFYENRAAYLRCRWIGPGKGWVDPVKEAQAARERIAARVSTIEDECAEQGKDWEEVFEQLAREEEKRKELNLPDNNAKTTPALYKDSTLGPEGGDANDAPTDAPQDAPVSPDKRQGNAELAALRERFDALERGVLAAADVSARTLFPPETHIHQGDVKVDVEPTAALEPRRALLEHEVLEVDAKGLPSKVRQVYAMPDAAEPPPEPEPRPAPGTVLRETIKTVLERDAEGRIFKTREVEVAQ